MIGRSHPSLRRVRDLRKDRHARDVEGVFVAEGIHLAEEALRAGAEVETAVISPRLGASDAGLALRRGPVTAPDASAGAGATPGCAGLAFLNCSPN